MHLPKLTQLVHTRRGIWTQEFCLQSLCPPSAVAFEVCLNLMIPGNYLLWGLSLVDFPISSSLKFPWKGCYLYGYSKFLTYKPSSCKLAEMLTCISVQQGTRICTINVRCEQNCSSPSVSHCWRPSSSAISHLLSLLLLSVTLLAWSVDTSPSTSMPAVGLDYYTFQGSVL